MNLRELLSNLRIDPAKVIAMRHRPEEENLRRALPLLVHEQPEVFNAYQQYRGCNQEKALQKLAGNGCLASFVALKPGTAIFAGLYEIRAARPVGYEEFWEMEANHALKSFGLPDWGLAERHETCLWFDLELRPSYPHWIGKLEVSWPEPEISSWRYAHAEEIPVISISDDSRFLEWMPG